MVASRLFRVHRGQHLLAEPADRLLHLRSAHHPVEARRACELLGVPVRVTRAAGQPAGVFVHRFEAAEGWRQTAGHEVQWRLDRHLDRVVPDRREMSLELGDRVEVAGWNEGLSERIDPPDAVDAARTILPWALPTGSVGSLTWWWPSSTAITRPRASAAVRLSGGRRRPRPTRYPP